MSQFLVFNCSTSVNSSSAHNSLVTAAIILKLYVSVDLSNLFSVVYCIFLVSLRATLLMHFLP